MYLAGTSRVERGGGLPGRVRAPTAGAGVCTGSGAPQEVEDEDDQQDDHQDPDDPVSRPGDG